MPDDQDIEPPKQTWYLCDLVSGKWSTRLPIITNQIASNLAQIDRSSLTLQVAEDACPDDWLGYFTPAYNRMIVLCLGEGQDEQPALGWWVDGEVEVGDWTVTIPVVSLEACYDTANVPELYGTYDDAYAAAQLCITDVGPDGTPTGLGGMGQRFGFTHEYAFTGNTSDHDYSAAETQTIYAAMKAMMDDGRIEFRCLVRWADNTHQAFTKVTQIKYRVGTYRKDSVFSFIVGADGQAAGTVASYKRRIGRGATAVTGTATVQGSTSVVNPPVVADELVTDPNRFPVVELRKTYTGLDSSDSIEAALMDRSEATLAATKGGVVTWSFVLRPGTLLPGRDFDAGDTVPYRVSPRPKVDPIGGAGDQRLLGYSMSLPDGTVTPTLWPNPDDDGTSS